MMPWRHETRSFSRARFAGLAGEWSRSVGFFSAVVTFFYGLIFVLNPLSLIWPAFRTVPPSSVFARWGVAGVFVIGVVFICVSIWDVMVSTREGYTVTVVVLSGFGILSAISPVNIGGMVFYVLILAATFYRPRSQRRAVREVTHERPGD